ncbi:hypothetical protein AbraCBS73388_008329 [Aspergillus brasiliensis]|uniref:Uncharacterized protein n=1 Tax=Aspergillus brasiliensis TaxID=319629 RepID=A0A9W6DJ70_9EURO|nr:hypothetical protein AbraCBS73388_008329 [Aspergillus brasiliensis]
MCGSVQINGHLFCKGLYKLRPSRSMASISPVAYLIDGALLRSQNGHNSTATLSMGELVTMYRNHKATIQHDKIYALLGLSADGAALTPNYELAWHEVLKQLVEHVFPRCSVETWCGSDLAIIKGKGWVLGYIYLSSVSSEDGQQIFKVVLNQTCQKLGYPDKWETEWSLQASGELIQDGDIICLLEGQSAPSILRLCVDHYTVVTPVVKPKQQVPTNKDNMMVGESQYTHSLCNILLNWRISQAEDKADIQSLSRLVEIAPNYHEEYELGASGKGALHELLTKGNVDVDEESLPWGDTDISGERKAAIVHSLWQQDELPSAWNEAFAVAVQVSGPSDYIMSSILIQRLGEELSVSEEVVKAAAASNGWYGPGIVQQLIEYYGDCLPVTEEVVKTAAANDTWCGPVIMYQLFRHHGDSLPVSEEVVKAAAANKGDHGSEIMQQLFENYGDSLPVTEQVVQTAAANDGDYGLAIMQQLINHCEDRLPVSEEVVEEAANNRRYGSEIMQQLVKHYGDSLPVSEERW